MVAHELVTNASKYGAFSDHGGSVTVQWQQENGRLRLVWQERGGPPVNETKVKGFGFDLLHGPRS